MPGTFFEELGFNYIGPVDGHDIAGLVSILQNVRKIGGLQLVHVVTKKVKVMNLLKKIQQSTMEFHPLILN